MLKPTITRRELIKRTGVTLAGLGGLSAIGVAKANPSISIIANKAVPNDAAVFLRNWFVNLCPLLTRLPWIPVDHADFHIWSHRHATEAEKAGRPGFFTVGHCATMAVQAFRYPIAKMSAMSTVAMLPGGIRTPLEFNRHLQLQNMANDVERFLYFGDGKTDNGYRTMLGLSSLVPVTRVDQSPHMRLGSAITRCKERGGDPDLLVLPTETLKKLIMVDRVPCGETIFGTPIHTFKSKAFPNQTIIEAPLLQPGCAAVLTSSEVYIRDRVRPHVQEDVGPSWYFECALAVVNRHHHEFLRQP